MKFKIVYDNNKDRIRLRCGKYGFTEEEGYGITELLLSKSNVTNVKVSSINGSVLVEYTSDKNSIVNILINLKQKDLNEVKPSEEEISQNIDRKYRNKLIFKIAERYIAKLILPMPLYHLKIVYESIPFIKLGLNSLLHLRLDVDVLDGTSITVALLSGMFNPAGSIVFLLGLSEILEEYTIEKTKHSLKSSLVLNVDKVWIQTETGEEVQIPFTDVKEGNKVVIRTGTVIPVDGTIIEGEAEVNESTMTGESLAIHKNLGKTVFAGTIVENGTIVVEVNAINEETRINQILELIENSEKAKAGIESKAERLADSIVPLNFALTALTYILTGDSMKALAALTVDYSCAIKLATPITIISTMKEASEQEMVVKGGRYLEAYALADTMIFDKTGTLTASRPHVAKVVSLGVLSNEEVLRQAACLEEHFPHSVANAIVDKAKEEKLEHFEELHTEVEYIVAHGIASTLLGKRVIIGSEHFVIEDEGVELSESKKEIIKENMNKYSVIYFAIDGNLEGIICIDDPPREEAQEVLAHLRQLGIKEIIMLTGDSENAASTTAEMLGITNYRSQVLPEDKASIVEKVKAEGNKVIMVGDGINDSPALSTADVSVAMKDSSDIAREVADITLLRPNLYDLVTMRVLSTRMLDVIHKDYIAITTINTTLIFLGILGVITPAKTALFHNGSTMLLGLHSANSMKFENIPQPELD